MTRKNRDAAIFPCSFFFFRVTHDGLSDWKRGHSESSKNLTYSFSWQWHPELFGHAVRARVIWKRQFFVSRVNRKHFEEGGFRKWWCHNNHVIYLCKFSSFSNPKWPASFAFLCGISPHFVWSGDISLLIYLFVYESQVFVTWSLLGREGTLGMRPWEWVFVCSGHYSTRVLSVGELFRLVFSVRWVYKVRRSLIFF